MSKKIPGSASRPVRIAPPSETCIALIAAVLLASCGGGGGGGGGSGGGTPPPPPPTVTGNVFAPTTGPGDTENYFPSSTGNKWFMTYASTETGAAGISGISTTSVTGTRTVLGVSAKVLLQEDSTGNTGSIENYYAISAGGITFVGDNDAEDDITPQLVPWAQLLFPVNLGTVSSLSASNLPLGTDASGNPITVNLTQRIDNVSFEPLNVPAGAFPQALKQVTTISGTVSIAKLNLSVSLSGSQARWLVPGVGVIGETTSTTLDTDTSTSTASLRGYVLDGVQRGFGLPFLVADGLSPVSGDPNPPIGQPVVGTDGARFLVVTRRITGVSPDYSAAWQASVAQADGTVLATVALEAARPVADPGSAVRAAVAFDGANYLVVFERDNNFASTGNHPSLMAVRVSPAGTLVGAATQVAPPGSNSPSLAFDGARYLLVFSRSDLYEGYGQLYGAFISPADGQVAGAGEFPITPAPGYQWRPALAFGGTSYLVVWDQTDFNGQPPGVIAARITPVGDILDPAGFAVYAATACCLGYRPTVAFDGDNYLVAWQDYRQLQDNLHTDIYASRVTRTAQLLDGPGGFPVTTAAENIEVNPRLVFFDGNYLAAWISSPAIGVYAGLNGARISPSGTVISPGESGMLLTAGGYEFHPSLAANASSAMLTWLNPRPAADVSSAGALGIYPFGP